MNRQLPRILCLLMAGALLAGCANSTPAKPSETEPEESVVEEQPADTADTAGDEQAALDAYQQFLEEEGFSPYLSEESYFFEDGENSYCFLDLDADGIPELILSGNGSNNGPSAGFEELLVFGYDTDTAAVVSIPFSTQYGESASASCFGGYSYSSTYKALQFSETRPADSGGCVDFYTLQNGTLTCILTIGYEADFQNGKASYFKIDSSGNSVSIDEAEYNACLEECTSDFDTHPLTVSISASTSSEQTVPSNPASASSGKSINEDSLQDITSGYWYNQIQDIDTFKFNADGTWSSIYDHDSGWKGTYTLSGNHLDLYFQDGGSISLEYLPLNELMERASNKSEAEHWIDLISKNWNYSGNLFYEVDFIGDGFGENAFYCIPSTENPFA